MSSMEPVGIVVTILLGLPIAVAANLLSPAAGRALGRISAARLAKNTEKAARARARTEFYISNPDQLTHRLLLDMVGTASLSAALVGLVFAMILITFLRLDTPSAHDLIAILMVPTGLLAVTIVYMVALRFAETLNEYGRVRARREELGLPVDFPTEEKDGKKTNAGS